VGSVLTLPVDAVPSASILLYKLLILVFNLVPYIAPLIAGGEEDSQGTIRQAA
jgi:hypothetical protein